MKSLKKHRGGRDLKCLARRDRVGVFTIETLIAFGLLSTLIVAVTFFVRHCNRVSERILSRMVLQDCVANTMERIKSLPFDEVTVERCKAMPIETAVVEKFPNASWVVQVTNAESPIIAKKVDLSIAIRDEMGREQIPISLAFWVPSDTQPEVPK